MTYFLAPRAGDRAWRCSDCGIDGWSRKEFVEHNLSLRHHYAMEEMNRRGHHCSICKVFYTSLAEYVNHVNGRGHLEALRHEGLSLSDSGYRNNPVGGVRIQSSQSRYEHSQRHGDLSYRRVSRYERSGDAHSHHLRDHEYTRSVRHQNHGQSHSTKEDSRQGDRWLTSKNSSERQRITLSRDHDRKFSVVLDSTREKHESSLDKQNRAMEVLSQNSKHSIEAPKTSSHKEIHILEANEVGDLEKQKQSSLAVTASAKSDKLDQSCSVPKQKTPIASLPEYLSLEVDTDCSRSEEQTKAQGNEFCLGNDGGAIVDLASSSSGTSILPKLLNTTDAGDTMSDINDSSDVPTSSQEQRPAKHSHSGDGMSPIQRNDNVSSPSLSTQNDSKSTNVKPLKDCVTSPRSLIQLKKINPLVVQKVLSQTQGSKLIDNKTEEECRSTLESPSKKVKPNQSTSSSASSVSDNSSEKAAGVVPLQQDLEEKRVRLQEACKKIDKQAIETLEKKKIREAARWMDQESARSEQWHKAQQQVQSKDSPSMEPEDSSKSLESPTKVPEGVVTGSKGDNSVVTPPSAMADAMSRLCSVPGSTQTSAMRPQCQYVLEDGKQCGVITFSQFCPYHKELQTSSHVQPEIQPHILGMDGSIDMDDSRDASDHVNLCFGDNETSVDDEKTAGLVWDDSQLSSEADDTNGKLSSTYKTVKNGTQRSGADRLDSRTEEADGGASRVVTLSQRKRKPETVLLATQKKPRMSSSNEEFVQQSLRSTPLQSSQQQTGIKHKWTKTKKKCLPRVNKNQTRTSKGQRTNSQTAPQKQQNDGTWLNRDIAVSNELMKELATVRNRRGKALTEVRKLQSRMDILYGEIRQKLKREGEIVAQLNKMASSPVAASVKSQSVDQTQTIHSLQGRRHRTSQASPQPLLSTSAGSEVTGGSVICNSETSVNTGSKAATSRRIVTVGNSSGSSSHSLTTPRAHKLFEYSSSEVEENSVLSSSDLRSKLTSQRQCNWPIDLSPTAMSPSKLKVTISSTTSSKSVGQQPASTFKAKSSLGKKQVTKESSRSLSSSNKQGEFELLSPQETFQLMTSSSTSAVSSSPATLTPSKKQSSIVIKPDPDGQLEVPLRLPSGKATQGPFHGHAQVVCCLKASDGILMSCSTDGMCCLFNTQTHQVMKKFTDHSAAITSVQLIVADGNYRLFSGSQDQTVRRFDLQRPASRACTHNFRFSSQVTALHSNWDVLFVGLGSGNVCCLDVKANKLAIRYDCHSPNEVICLATGSEGTQRLLLSGSNDKTIRVRHAETGLLVRTLTGHQQSVLCMTIHNDHVFSGGLDKSVHVHNYHTGKIERIIHGHKGKVTGIECLDDLIITTSYDQHVRCYDAETFKLLQVCWYDEQPVHSLATLLPDMVYIGSRNGAVNAVKVDLLESVTCKWTGCGMNFGSGDSLHRHITGVHKGKLAVTFQCQWFGCKTVFRGHQPETDFSEHITSHLNKKEASVIM